MKILLALLSLVCVCGCAPNKSLARKLEKADRAVLINPRDGTSITVTGEDVGKIINAIASGKKEPRTVEAAHEYDLKFYKGDEPLATVSLGGLVFWAERPYSDTTGTLDALIARFREEHRPKF